MIRAVLCDIEGTTTPLSFVHNVLFPLSRERMDRYIREHWSELQPLVKNLGNDPENVAHALKKWIEEDRKDNVLKQIQGKIWKEAFESGELRSHVYEDVPVVWLLWKKRGIRINIFSSGSVEAQKLLFQYTEGGDLRSLIDGYFDTSVGSKKEVQSYKNIAESIQLKPEEIAFLSDVAAELDAARSAGMRTFHLNRERSLEGSSHPIAQTFYDTTV